MKCCRSCERTKPLADFAIKHTARDGRDTRCKVCINAIATERREAERKARPPKPVPPWHTCPRGTAWCRRCSTYKPTSEFYRCRANDSGLQVYCKPCALETGRQWVRSLDPSVRADRLAAIVAWRMADRDRYVASMRQSRERRRDQRDAVTKLWRKRNPAKVRDMFRRKSLKRRAAKRAFAHHVTAKALADRARVFGNACAYCGGPHEHWDHVIPLSRGGRHCLANLRPSCKACNLRKYVGNWRRWLASCAAKQAAVAGI